MMEVRGRGNGDTLSSFFANLTNRVIFTVNRAARVAAQCEPGQVCVGVPMGDGEEPPDPGPSVDVDVLGVKQLKGISVEMALFACRKKHSKAKSMLT